ncbi:MAG: cysteine desulfurase family protein [Candidatus Paceibacteria bacterium]
MTKVYLDHAATTPVADSVMEKMKPFFNKHYGNPSALHKLGVEAKEAVESAREEVAENLKTQPDTCFFTGSATEANNIALLGAAKHYSGYGKHIITTKLEHPSVLNPVKQLEQEGFDVTYLDVDDNGWFDLKELEEALCEDTILVSLMYVNNEIGNIYPIQRIGKKILNFRQDKENNLPLFHTDACQASNYLHLDVRKLHADLLVINGSKIYGPKGVGVLYKNRNIELEPIMFGGGQEKGLRSGTENVPGIVGMAEALTRVQDKKEEERDRLFELQQHFLRQIRDKFDRQVSMNGADLGVEQRAPNNLNLSFSGIEGEKLLLYLDSEGIYCSSGSACSLRTNKDLVNAVDLLCGCSEYSVRFTMGENTTREKVNYVVDKLEWAVEKIN